MPSMSLTVTPVILSFEIESATVAILTVALM
jgi:hypothetical protein